ncbi:MAG TPA: hypothetical protein VGA50_18300 [Kiloniellales bacterium]
MVIKPASCHSRPELDGEIWQGLGAAVEKPRQSCGIAMMAPGRAGGRVG